MTSNKDTMDIDNKVDDATKVVNLMAESTNEAKHDTGGEIPKEIEAEMLKIRIEFRMTGAGVFDKATAFSNVATEILTKVKHVKIIQENRIDFMSNPQDLENEQLDKTKFYYGEVGKKESNQNKFMMVFLIRLENYTTYDQVKAAMVPFLKQANAWMSEHVFESLDLTSIGFLSLRHATWTHIPSLVEQIALTIFESSSEMDSFELTADQKESLRE